LFCVFIFFTLLLPWFSYIEINEQGIVIKNVFNTTRCNWNNLISVGVTNNGGVALRLSKPQKTLDKASVKLFGYQKLIPNLYQFDGNQIVCEIHKAIDKSRT
ncbi:hypothetical protein, partial [Thalassotalea ganghwensis]